MSCNRAWTTSIEDLLLEPDSPATLEFRNHCETCDSCASELTMHESLILKLQGVDPFDREWHPADEELLLLHSRSTNLDAQLRSRLNQHLGDCSPCHDAFESFRQLAPVAVVQEESAISVGLDRLTHFVSDLLDSLRPARAAIGVVALVGIAVLITPNDPALDPGQEGPLTRGTRTGEEILPEIPQAELGGLEVTLLADDTVVSSSQSFAHSEKLRLNLLLPSGAEVPDRLFVSFHSPNGHQIEAWHSVGRGEHSSIEVLVDSHSMTPGRYVLELYADEAYAADHSASVPLYVYTLVVR